MYINLKEIIIFAGDNMAVCTFFGHRDVPQPTVLILKKVLADLIQHQNITTFYVGNHGKFDSMVRDTLKQLKIIYPHINYAVILAYMPGKKNPLIYQDGSDTVFPVELTNIPPKYAIIKRNQWMLKQSDYVVVYVTHAWGGAAQWKALAEKKGKTIINLADVQQEKI